MRAVHFVYSKVYSTERQRARMANLKELGLKALRPADAGKTLSDGDSLFGMVRANKAGTVTVWFFYRYRRDGKPYNLGCGTWPSKSLKEIRIERDKAKGQRNEETDPADDRRKGRLDARLRQKDEIAQQEAKLARMTVRELFERWASLELAGRKDQGAETRRGLEKDLLSAIGERYAADVTRADIMAILDTVKARNANRLANRLLSEMRQMFGFALVREIISVDPTYGIKKKDVGGKETERDRTLSEAEIRSLPAKLEDGNMLESTKHAIWVMLATLARIGELTGAMQRDVDMDAGVWKLPDTKNGESHTIYLSEFAKKHMAALMRLAGSSEWVMPGTQTDGSVCAKSITKQIYDRQRGKEKMNGTKKTSALLLLGGKWVPHDLRRTGATLMGELSIDGDVIEKCLNHTEENKVKRTYQRAVRELEQRDAWRVLGERLELLTASIAP